MSSAKEQLKALFEAFETKNNNSGGNSMPNWKKFYQFWKMPDDSTAVIRFLPDRDEDSNPLKFLVENLSHDLVINGQKKKVPCLSMYGESCPICEHSQKLYSEGDEDTGKRYYKKRSYIGQVIVVESPFEYIDPKDAETDTNPIRLIDFGPKIFKCIKSAFKSGDLEEPPQSYTGGYNFRIKKTKAGQYSDYGTSSFAPKQSSLDDDLISTVRNDLYSLSEFREKHMTRAALEAMLLADLTGAAVAESKNSEPSAEPVKHEPTSTPDVPQSAGNTESASATPDATPASKGLSVLEQLRQRAAANKAANSDAE